jgi:hypothetical protein
MGEPEEDFENELDGANEYPLVFWGLLCGGTALRTPKPMKGSEPLTPTLASLGRA